jgi:group I intron endonuclease
MVYGIIYCTTNLINGKKYIGKRVYKYTANDATYLGSGILLSSAIKKYGKENFKRETLHECYSKKELLEKEVYYIDLFKANISSEFYNLADGGDGGDLSFYKSYRRVCQYDLNGKLINVFDNGRDAERELGNYTHKVIHACCTGKKNKNKEFMFKFFEETDGKDIEPYVARQGDYLKRKVNQFSLNGELINTFESISLAERLLNTSNIRACCVGIQKTAGGYIWKYAA